MLADTVVTSQKAQVGWLCPPFLGLQLGGSESRGGGDSMAGLRDHLETKSGPDLTVGTAVG